MNHFRYWVPYDLPIGLLFMMQLGLIYVKAGKLHTNEPILEGQWNRI